MVLLRGAHFVQLRFPGLPGLYSFHQFASVLNRPEIIAARLAGASDVPPPRLVPRPVVEARLLEEPSGPRRVKVEAHSSEGLAHLRLYEDGLLGVDSYGEERLKLSYAKSDARRLAQAFQASVGRYYGSDDLHLLLDEQATPGAIAAALEGMVAAADPHDSLVISFAGHGVKGEDDHDYLAPFGYRSNDP